MTPFYAGVNSKLWTRRIQLWRPLPSCLFARHHSRLADRRV